MIVAVGMVKDEVDVIERTLLHLADQGVDLILLLENDSTDGTWPIVRDLRDTDALHPTRLEVLSDPDPAYYQSRKMTMLAQLAAERHARWVIPFDADELWRFDGGTIADGLAELGPLERRGCVIEVPLFNYYRTPHDVGGHPFDSMRWHDPEPLGLPKVMFTARSGAVVHAGNHGVDHRGARLSAPHGFRVCHYPYRSAEQFVSKARNGAAAYRLTDLPRSTGQHWREYGETLDAHGPEALREHYRAAFVRDPAGLTYDPPS